MAQAETNILNRVRLACSKLGMVTFRNQVGLGWVGRPIRTFPNGDVLLKSPYKVRMGLGTGSADTVGWQSVVITPSMVGQRIARFLSIEVKTDDGVVSKEQAAWMKGVNDAGGIAFVARKPEDVEYAIK